MPRGQTKHLEKDQFKQRGDRPLAKAPIGIRLPEDIDIKLRSWPDRNKWLQELISNAVMAREAETSHDQETLSA